MSFASDRFRRHLLPMFTLGLGVFAFLFHLSVTMSVAAPPAQQTATPSPDVQTASDPESGEWTPVNLSRSGAATDASMVMDTDGVVHVVWQEDGDDSFYYAQGENSEWLSPTRLEFPFGTRAFVPDLAEDDSTPLYQPTFVAVDGSIFAFWIDDEGAAFSSTVSNSEFATFSAWSAPQPIAGDVLELSVAVGESNALHMAYVRNADTVESPAGIYYTGSDSSGTVWSEPIPLYNSRYFRTVPVEEAHLQVAADGVGDVFIVWDSRAVDQILVVTSNDGGQNWADPQVVDYHRPEDSPEAAGPSQIQVRADDGSVHLVWTAAHTTPLCTVYHQWSDDGGNTWEESQQVLAETTNCPERPRLAWGLDGTLFLLADVGTEARLVAWQDGRWSESQLQSTLSSFFNPANNRRIEFQWQHISFLDTDRLIVVGTETEEPGDVWALLGSVGTITDWFPPASLWQTPVSLGTYAAEADEIVMLSDSQEFLHAFWTQPASNDVQADVIEYARWSNMEWGRSAPVLGSPSDPSINPSVAADLSGRLYAVWSAGPGQLYFSQALAAEANVAREWSEPFVLPVEHEAARSPVIAVDGEGVLYVAYAVSLNEGRGVFLIASEDSAATWNTPVQVFDAAAAGWAMVDRPRLVVGANGALHLIWSRYSLPPRSEPLALLYARSESGGDSWSEPEVVDEGAILWSQIAYGRDTTLHQVWQKQEGNRFAFWHRFSPDEGLSWSRAETAGFDSASAGVSELAARPGGLVHLFNLVDNTLLHWWWENEGWTAGEPFMLEEPNGEAAEMSEPVLAAAVAADGTVAVLYSRPTLVEGQEQTVQYQLLATERMVETGQVSESVTPPPELSLTQTPTATFTPTPSSSPTPTPAIGFPTDAESDNGASLNIPGTGSPLGQIAISLALVGLLIIVVAVFTLRTLWDGRK